MKKIALLKIWGTWSSRLYTDAPPRGLLRVLDVEAKDQSEQVAQPGEVAALHHLLDGFRDLARLGPDGRADVAEGRVAADDFLVVLQQAELPALAAEGPFREGGDELWEGDWVGRGGGGAVGAYETGIEGCFDKEEFEESEIGIFGGGCDGVG